MRRLVFIISVLCCQSLTAQVDRFSKSVQVSQLEQIDLSDSEKALKEISTILEDAVANNDYEKAGDCYVLLGKIYNDKNQYDLSLGRQQTALEYYQLSGTREKVISQWLVLGDLFKKTNQLAEAEHYYQLCVESADTEEVKLKCTEGLADVLLLKGDTDKSLEYYDNVDDAYQANNLPQSNARVKLKKAKVFAKKKDETKARENYKQGYENYSPEATEEDLAVLEETKETIIELEPVDGLPVRRQNAETQSNIPKAKLNVVKENVKITESLVNEGNLEEAKIFNDYNIASTLEPIVKKDYYKLSSEINYKKGNYEEALNDLQQYEALTKEVLNEKTEEQDELISILKGQRVIDLKAKDVTIKSNKLAYDTSLSKRKNWIIGLLSLLLLGSLIAFYLIYRNIKARKQANQLLMLKSLRAQMNPHFIFNVLNSINHYISKNDERSANKYLSEFSKLMRKVLHDSQKDLITLEDELEMTELYLNLEHSRFADKFDYTVTIDDRLDLKEVNIPPMMIQPFLENAVWHGMRYKQEKGIINLDIAKVYNGIKITISDNGIGRAKSKLLKTKNQQTYQSTGLKNIASRLDLVNDIYGKSYDINIEDLHPSEEDTGTLITIIINQ